MNDHEIILAIQEMIDGVEWDSDTLPAIADLLTNNGYAVRNSDETSDGTCPKCGASTPGDVRSCTNLVCRANG